jgi:hypothetical protein
MLRLWLNEIQKISGNVPARVCLIFFCVMGKKKCPVNGAFFMLSQFIPYQAQ